MNCKFESCIMANISPLNVRMTRQCHYPMCCWFNDDNEDYCMNPNLKGHRIGKTCRFHVTINEMNMIMDPYLM